MCRTSRRKNMVACHPKPKTKSSTRSSETLTSSEALTSTTTITTTTTTTSGDVPSSSSSSFAGYRDTLRDAPILFPFAEISAAFLAPRLGSSAWRCYLRGGAAAIVLLRRPAAVDLLLARLSALRRCHHTSLAPLLGASLDPTGSSSLYLAYSFVPGPTLARCLRNPLNPSFTPLASWASRMHVAADVAQGLEYIHHHCSIIHNKIDTSSILVDDGFRAKILYFGAAELQEKEGARVEGTRGYMAPEVIAGVATTSKESDVFAFGVVLLELLSGEEAVRYHKGGGGGYERVSLIETARVLYEDENNNSRRGRIRRWVDGRLKDSFPEDVVEKMIMVALRCVTAEAGQRPDMVWVAGKVSRLLIDSMAWEEKVRGGANPADSSASFAPR